MNPELRSGGTGRDVDLRTLFRDPDVAGSAVRVNVRIGTVTKTIDIALFDQQTPITVANFLAYVNSGRHNANFFHRSVPGFVVQGGGFAWSETDEVVSVPTYAQIQNEPGISNLRGTVAMAKLGGNANSATSQWFVNLADNSANLDGQNGGFTVFGRVVGNGMSVVDEVAALPRVNAGSPFDTLPVKDFTGGTILRSHTIETSSQVFPTLTFQATSSDPALVGVTVNGSTLQLTPSPTGTGTAIVTLRATDLDGATTESNLAVHVLAKGYAWAIGNAPDGQPSSFQLNAFTTPQPTHAVLPLEWGSVGTGSSTSRTFSVTNNGPTPLHGLTLSSTGAAAADFQVTDGAVPRSVAPGATVDFTVNFSPLAHGTRSAVLRIAATQPSEAVLELNASGTGIDITPPNVTSPSPQTLIADATRSATVPDFRGTVATATDDAAIASFTQSPAPGSELGMGDYTLEFTAIDTAGNTKSAQTTLTIAYGENTPTALVATGAYSGSSAPAPAGASLPEGSTLSAFGAPAISDDRSLAARVTIAAGRAKLAGIYRETASGEGALVAVQGQSSGLAGATFKSFRDPLLSSGGAIAFIATMNARATENEGVWTDRFGNLTPVLQKGAALPGSPNLKLKSVTSLSFDDDALLAFVKLAAAPGFVTAANDTALIRITSPLSATILARTGKPFENSSIKQISVLQPAARSAGQGRSTASAGAVAKLTLADRRTVIARLLPDGGVVPLLRSAELNATLGATFATFGLPAIGGESVALLATKTKQPGMITGTNDSTILFAADGSAFSEAAKEDPAPSGFVSFSDPVANDQGELLVFGIQRGPAARTPNVSGLWLTNGASAPELVAQVGGPAVDRVGQNIPNATYSAFTSFALPDGTGSGPVFVAQLKGVEGQSKLGLWALDSGGVVKLLLRTGDNVVLPSGTKQLKGFTVLNALPGSYGARRSYNSAGSIAVQATFTDRSQAVLRIDIP